jgi:hypothetical protein
MPGPLDEDLRRRNRRLAGILIAVIAALMVASAVVILSYR